MCGIVGIWSDDVAPAERRRLVGHMLRQVAERGPDSETIVTHRSLSLGFSRLSIVGSPGLVQPSKYRNVISAVNGEIYNYADLWRSLPTDVRSSVELTSDCAVVAPLAALHGAAFVEQLDGAFAGVVADTNGRSLLMFRDQVGIKPLYYAKYRGGVAFGSTVRALAAIVGADVDRRAVLSYLEAGYVAGPQTMLKGIRKVPAGTTVYFPRLDSGPKVTRWFRRTRRPTESCVGLAVTESIESEVPEIGPVMSTLSGGIDSTLVTLLAARSRANVIALTIRYPDIKDDPDLIAARMVADEFKLRHDVVTVTSDDYLAEVANNWRFDQPLADPNAIALNRMCQRVREHGGRVLLTGDGADELFCGYPYYLNVAGRSFRHHLASWRFTSMTDDQDREFVEIVTGKKMHRPLRPMWGDPLLIAQQTDIDGWLEANLLEKSDRFGMADQVEIRTPFLRKRVIQSAMTLSTSSKVDARSGLGKIALRTAFAAALPSYVVNREKQGFPCPISHWLRGNLGRQLRADATWAVADEWDVGRERELWDVHISGKQDWGQHLWRLAVARSWWRTLTQPA